MRWILFTWGGWWVPAHEGVYRTRREAEREARNYDNWQAHTRIISTDQLTRVTGWPKNPDETEPCHWCGSTLGYETTSEGDWPRCRNCRR